MRTLLFLGLCLSQLFFAIAASAEYTKDTVTTDKGDLLITFLGHASLMLEYQGKVIHVDPVSRIAEYSKLPKADLILVTHEHGDHYDVKAIEQLQKSDTQVIINSSVASKGAAGKVMANGDSGQVLGLPIRAVPAYNIVHKRDNGEPFHPSGRDNGFVLTFANVDLYIAGDTENIPEMNKLTGIEIAFLPMNLPYTMSPKMVADAVRGFKPKVMYPYHYSGTDPDVLLDLLDGQTHTEIRVRKMYDD